MPSMTSPPCSATTTRDIGRHASPWCKGGKRVYWPGTGPDIGDYHLIDIGNDVVFGSRSNFITSDATSSEMITIKDRAMVADPVHVSLASLLAKTRLWIGCFDPKK